MANDDEAVLEVDIDGGSPADLFSDVSEEAVDPAADASSFIDYFLFVQDKN